MPKIMDVRCSGCGEIILPTQSIAWNTRNSARYHHSCFGKVQHERLSEGPWTIDVGTWTGGAVPVSPKGAEGPSVSSPTAATDEAQDLIQRLNPVTLVSSGQMSVDEALRRSCIELGEAQGDKEEASEVEKYWRIVIEQLYWLKMNETQENNPAQLWDGSVPGYGRLIWSKGSSGWRYDVGGVDSVLERLTRLSEEMEKDYDQITNSYGRELGEIVKLIQGCRLSMSSKPHLETRRGK